MYLVFAELSEVDSWETASEEKILSSNMVIVTQLFAICENQK